MVLFPQSVLGTKMILTGRRHTSAESHVKTALAYMHLITEHGHVCTCAKENKTTLVRTHGVPVELEAVRI